MKSSCLLVTAVLLAAPWFHARSLADSATGPGGEASLTTVPITLDLPQAGYVTLVAEDEQGRRVGNLLSQSYLPAGRQRINWDGLDAGVVTAGGGGQGEPPITRHRVKPGSYHLRGLLHTGLHLTYEFPVYNAGNPPWFNAAGSGGWLSDHNTPCAILLLPPSASPYGDRNAPQFLMSSQVAEEGSGLIWTTVTGQKLFGKKLQGWNGGYALASDIGSDADAGAAAYSLVVDGAEDRDPHGGYEIWRIGKNESATKIFRYTLPDHFVPTDGFPQGPDLAVHNGIAVISDLPNDALVVVNVRRHTLLGTIPLKDPHGLAFDEQGSFYVLTDHRLRRFQFDPSSLKLNGGEPVVATSFDDPQRVMVSGGRIFVSDWGKSHQVKEFDKLGRLVGVYGEAGGPETGPYNELRMHLPLGMALDPRGQLWVMEHDWLPKRVSVWSPARKLIGAFYGPTQYGGGGMIDPQDKSSFYYGSNMSSIQGGMKFHLDWNTGTSRLTDVFLRGPSPSAHLMRGWNAFFGGNDDHQTFYNSWDRTFYPYDFPRSGAPERAIHVNGNLYLTNVFNGWERSNSSNGIFQMGEHGTVKPVAVAGPLDILLQRWALSERHLRDFDAIKAATKNMDSKRTVFVWSDLNGDGFMEPGEFQFLTMPPNADGHQPTASWSGAYVDDQLAITTCYGLQLTPVRFTDAGVPVYDLKGAKRLAPVEDCQPVAGRNGWFVNARGPILTGYKDGQKNWEIATYGYNYVPQDPGEMVDPTRLLGPTITPTQGQAGETFAINGEKGSLYLVTTDGLLIQNIGGDIRTTPLVRFPEAKRGMDIVGHSLEDENFHPTIEQVADGNVYVVAGKEYTGIYHLGGLETVKRLDFGTIAVTEAELAGVPESRTEAHERRDAVTLTIPHLPQPPALAGQTNWVSIDNRTQAALDLSNGRLYASYRTGDPHLLENGGGGDAVLFKTGGGLDLMLRETVATPQPGNALAQGSQPIAGDLRLFVTRVRGQTRAMLYQAVVPGTPENSRVVLSSPIGNAVFDSITDVSAQVALTEDGKGDYQFSVPLTTLGWKPEAGKSYHGDLGVLRGNGTQTLQRAYWSNTTATIVSDVPSEARLQPMNWGTFRVQ